ncbi:hypothetical protein E2C01_076096 [Portunus trituberculatus]|uniref:Uncharacterized protein n=1 Tax=Portunus trituberculatus TaxID=210409 RepID=A0A5B7II19_PORTR|nr:hypothetical protein [Portunus trituberculatus]
MTSATKSCLTRCLDRWTTGRVVVGTPVATQERDDLRIANMTVMMMIVRMVKERLHGMIIGIIHHTVPVSLICSQSATNPPP